MNIENFDPNGTGIPNGNYFALPFTPEESALVLLSVPWDVTTSYGDGTAEGPDAIINASVQCDLYDHHNPEGWKKGIGTLPTEDWIIELSLKYRDEARKVINHIEDGGSPAEDYAARKLDKINAASAKVNKHVYEEARRWLDAGKVVGVVGGDHSTPFGLIRALSEREPLGILHIDAHADLREAYEGFEHSHASIMYNVITRLEGVQKLVQVGIRDTCSEEMELVGSNPKIHQYNDYAISESRFEGVTWRDQCEKMVAHLPDNVYVSFDIDGLSPENCPDTGTPVPGGLSFHEAIYLLATIRRSGRRIVGFDMCEVSPGNDNNKDWNANVGARVLYKLCNMTLL